MQLRRLGRTDLMLSVVGMGTSQLQMLPERQAVATLVRAFEGGVNWVHTAPDYGGIDPWIARAIRHCGQRVMVASGSPPRNADLEAFFENTCHVYDTPRLELYGIAGIEDIEYFGENVWGPRGMVEFLQRKKAEGRLGALYCTTHACGDEVLRLINSGVFDAIMLAWNPLGFHQQSHAHTRTRLGRGHEDLHDFAVRVMPRAAAADVGLLIMRPLAGGMLHKSLAFPPHHWPAEDAPDVTVPEVLRGILHLPGVCAVVPGMASLEEVDQNLQAGEPECAPEPSGPQRLHALVRARTTSTCSHCGACSSTCARQLPIAAMLRDTAIWTLRSETNQADPDENYFDLHPHAQPPCHGCALRSCHCPQGLNIPATLDKAHAQLQQLRQTRQHPGPRTHWAERLRPGPYPMWVWTQEVPTQAAPASLTLARFLVRNAGGTRWMAPQHCTPSDTAMAVWVYLNGVCTDAIPLCNTICPDQHYVPLVLEFAAPTTPGRYALALCLQPWPAALRPLPPENPFFEGSLVVTPSSTPPAPRPRYRATLCAHSLPAQSGQGLTHGVWLHLHNTGSHLWNDPADPAHPVVVELWVDTVRQASLDLPTAPVAPDGNVHLHFALRAPDTPGQHQLRVALVHQGVARFADCGAQDWEFPLTVVEHPWSRSVQLFEVERQHNPWHYNPFQGIARGRSGHSYPLFIERAQGCTVWDTEGHAYTDYTMGWGSTILGHAHPHIRTAISQALDCGPVLPLPHPLEMEVSQQLVQEFAPHDMVAFGKNGSDVCSIAARLARVTTGKRVILSCGYHGWQDFALEYFDFADCGIPYATPRNLFKFRFNDLPGFLTLLQRHKADLAAVMIEPAGPLIDDAVGLGGEPDPDFLHIVADATRRAHALLIFDEIVTGFRYRQGSVQRATGIVPDLTCLGKALASGMPLSALLGPQRLFLPAFHKTHFHPTFRGEVLSLAASKAALEFYRAHPVANHVWAHGARLRARIDALSAALGLKGACAGADFRFGYVFHEPDAYRRRLKRTLLMQELVKGGLLSVGAMLLPSYAHDEQAHDHAVRAFAGALEVVAQAERDQRLAQSIELVVN